MGPFKRDFSALNRGETGVARVVENSRARISVRRSRGIAV